MRLQPEKREQEILDAALRVATREGGWSSLTRAAVAIEAGCTDGLVSKYFGTMNNFRRRIMRAAIENEDLSIVAQGLARGDKVAQKANDDLKSRALSTLL